MVCQSGDSPTVEYKFGNGSLRRYKTELSPIEVQTKSAPVEGSNNFVSDGFGFSFISPNNNYRRYDYIVRDYLIIAGPTFSYGPNYREIRFMGCGETKIEPSGTGMDITSIIIDTSKKCPPQNPRCSIQIFHKGLIIFQDQGDCPCTFNVQCGRCPDNFIECCKPTYPGYCCISCGEIKSGIQSITSALRSVNRG